ncbi:metallopeptidase TldD-related protein [Stygiolobus caldivivus]|uniref:Metalloprotease TldD/E C-terminal domain-containing protein n=1 Tax=Stygiolobus caldivivus TaxID=2824673 RepID=A0A8D5ZJ19_9CREN|nr:metallopeptidase TldD-related protein [Stygiolobus caldivivus]BCU70141.1 hypothetical protein KN1_14380 [Stygiolobus caldivivus]
MQTFSLKEVNIHITPKGNFSEMKEINATRYFTKDGWSLTEAKEERVPDHDPCISFRSDSVDKFYKSKDIRVQEGSAISKKVVRAVNECVEEKVLNYVEYRGVRFAYAGDPSKIPTVVDFLRSLAKPYTQSRVFSLERITAILDPEVTLHIFHHVMSLLRSDEPGLKLEERLSPYLTVIDDPLNQELVGFSVFDDEGVRTVKKELIGDGYVLEYLGTLTKGKPGNARGVIPRPDYFNLIVKGGDWELEELREETKEGIIVSGVERSELMRKSIRIFPRRVTLLGKGDIIVREIAIPLQELVTIDALSKEVRSAFIDEEHGGIAPYIRMMVRPIIY